MNIHAINFARSRLPESMVLQDGDTDRSVEISFLLYVIESDHQRILIDAGCDTLPGFEMQQFVSPGKALADYGIDPGTITDVIITHAHHDHIDGLRHFPQATLHIQAKEFQKGQKYIPDTAILHIFSEKARLGENIEIIKIGGHTPGSSIVRVEAGPFTYVFAGDECYLPLCLERNIPTGTSHNPIASAEFIEEYRKPGYRVLLTHDTNIQTGKII